MNQTPFIRRTRFNSDNLIKNSDNERIPIHSFTKLIRFIVNILLVLKNIEILNIFTQSEILAGKL